MYAQQAAIGSWYRERQLGTEFEVVAIDDDSQTIGVQMLEGELCEYDLDSWAQLDLEPIEEPGDWRYAADEDRDVDKVDNWDNPIDLIEPNITNGLLEDDLP